MKKVGIIFIFIMFIGYSIFALFINIPPVLNNIFYGLITAAAVYYLIFHLDITTGIKKRFLENRENHERK